MEQAIVPISPENALVLAALVLGLTEAIKRRFALDGATAPLVAVGTGALLGLLGVLAFAEGVVTPPLVLRALLFGLQLGLAAAGLYGLGKHTLFGAEKDGGVSQAAIGGDGVARSG